MWKTILIVLVLFLSFPFRALTNEHEIRSLEGIDSVDVAVEDTGELSRLGITKNRIKVDTELKLRKAGIKVARGASPDGFLHINMTAIETRDNAYAIMCGVTFAQPVSLVRNSNIVTWGNTWNRFVLLYYGKDRQAEVRDALKDMVDDFINDYLSVNESN